MRFEMKMPDLATTESDIRIVRWLANPGQKVQRGQPLLEVETDKATMEVEAVVNGVLCEVCCQVDEAASVGQVIAVLEVEGTVSPGGLPAEVPRSKPEAVTRAVPSEPAARTADAPKGMFARNRAQTAADAPKKSIPLSVAQRVAAQRLQASKQTIPHFYLQTSANVSSIVARRQATQPTTLTWDAFFVQAVAKALAGFDRFSCRLEGEQLVPLESNAIGLAVDHQNELFVLPVASPATKTIAQLSDEIRQGVVRLRHGDPEARKMRPTLLTVSNLGVCNVESFIPIINPPEAAILAVGRVLPTPWVREDGSIGVEHRCTLTLSVDHRVANGRYAGEFLSAIVRELESPERSA